MAIFIDASALIAIIADEADADSLSDRLQADSVRLCSTVSAWEATVGLARSRGLSVDAARELVRRFLQAGGIRFVAMGETEFDLAIDAFARFGKGRHPARLNMGDCHAYACAGANGAKLLFKGNDFSLTDIDAA